MKKIIFIFFILILILFLILKSDCSHRTGGEDQNPDLLTKIGQLFCSYK